MVLEESILKSEQFDIENFFRLRYDLEILNLICIIWLLDELLITAYEMTKKLKDSQVEMAISFGF